MISVVLDSHPSSHWWPSVEWGEASGWGVHSTRCLFAPLPVACRRLECGSRAIPVAVPWVPLPPTAGAYAPSGGHLRALAIPCDRHWCSFNPEATSGGQGGGCLPSTVACLSAHRRSIRKVRLLSGTTNSPIMLAIDLTDSIIPAHSSFRSLH